MSKEKNIKIKKKKEHERTRETQKKPIQQCFDESKRKQSFSKLCVSSIYWVE